MREELGVAPRDAPGARGASRDHERRDIMARAQKMLISSISTRNDERLGTRTEIRHHVSNDASRNSTAAPSVRGVVGASQEMSQQRGRAGYLGFWPRWC